MTTCTARDAKVRFRNLPSTIACITVFATTSWIVAAAMMSLQLNKTHAFLPAPMTRRPKVPGPTAQMCPLMHTLWAHVTGPLSFGTTEVELMNCFRAHIMHRLCRREGVHGAVGCLSNCLLSALHWDLLQA